MIVTILATVEIVGKTGFSDCSALEIVRFEADSHLREIDGFSRCPLTEIFIPGTVQIIGPCAFQGCRFLARVKFAQPISARSIGTGAKITLPKDAQTRPGDFGHRVRLFLEEPESALSRISSASSSVIERISSWRNEFAIRGDSAGHGLGISCNTGSRIGTPM
jgi:hypothetical protein